MIITRRAAQAVFAIAMLLFLSCSSADESKIARKVLAQSTTAIQDHRSFSYDFVYEGYGSLNGNFVGAARLIRGDHPGRDQIWITMEVPNLEEDGPTANSLTITTDGESISAIDEQNRTYSFGTFAGGGAHLMSYAYYGVLFQLMQDSPYEKELSGGPIEWVKSKQVKGVECDIVKTENNSYGGADVWWYIGRKDHLPRGQKWVVTTPGVEGGFWFGIRNLSADPGFEHSDFELDVPDSFDRVDEDARSVEVGDLAPDWTLESGQGETIRLKDLRGNIVVLDFWASWCPPCWGLMPELDRVDKEQVGNGVRIFGVNAWESPNVDPLTFTIEKDLEYPILLHGETIASLYKVGSLPALFVIDRQGKLVFVQNPVVSDPETLRRDLVRGIELARGN